MVVWNRSCYLHEASRQLQDQNLYEDVKFNENILTDQLVKSICVIINCLSNHKLVYEKEFKYLTYSFKKATNFGKLYFVSKIHKRLSDIPGRPVISNCGPPTEKVSQYLDYIFKPISQDNWSYIKDPGDFLKKTKYIGKIPKDAILVTADVIGLYPSISHEDVLEALPKSLSERDSVKVPAEDIVRMADFVLKNNFFEFNSEVKRQKSGTGLGTKFASPYTCIFMDDVETKFLKSQELQPFLWLRYTDGSRERESPFSLLMNLTTFIPI